MAQQNAPNTVEAGVPPAQKKRGRPRAHTQPLTTAIDPTLKVKGFALAAFRGVSFSKIIDVALNDYFNSKERTSPAERKLLNAVVVARKNTEEVE